VVRELELLQHSFDERETQQTGETADVNILDGDELEVQELSQGVSTAMQFSSKRDDEGFGQPICPVMKCEEKKIDAMFSNFFVSRAQRENNRDQYGNYDYRALAE
jgi:hypothetical protein